MTVCVCMFSTVGDGRVESVQGRVPRQRCPQSASCPLAVFRLQCDAVRPIQARFAETSVSPMSAVDVEAPAAPAPVTPRAEESKAPPGQGPLLSFLACLRPSGDASKEGSVESLRASRKDAAAFVVNCFALGASGENLRVAGTRGRGAKAVVDGLASNLGSEEAQVAGCVALRRLARDGAGQEAVGAAGGVTAVLAAQAAFPSSARVQVASWTTLAALTLAPGNELQAVAQGALGTAVAVLSASEAPSPDVTEAVALALRNLCGSHKSQQLAAEAGAIPAVLQGLVAQSAHERPLAALLAALRNVTALGKNKETAADAGALQAVLGVLKAWPQSAGVQAPGLGALWSLAGSHGNKVRLATSGALDVIVASLREHSGDAAVQEAGLGAMASVAWTNLAYKERAIRAGGMQAVDAALAAFGDNPRVRTRASEARSRLRQTNDPDGDAFMPNM